MEHAESLDIAKTTRQEYFREAPVRSFFSKWCEINDSIHPSYITREQWQKRQRQGKGFLQRNRDKTNTLFIPTNLHLWEMAEVVGAIDSDTFVNKPELKERKKQEIRKSGREDVITRFDWETIAQEHIAFYESLIVV